VALRVELREAGVAVDGVEVWWDDIETTLSGNAATYPILETISPYGDARIPHERLHELAAECRLLANVRPKDASTALLKIADLSERAARRSDYELRFDGD
jgi:hypothetical protein